VLIIEKIIGNVADPQWSERLLSATLDILELDQWEAQKNRFRKKTASGFEVAVSLDRGTHIRDGDVLLWDAADSKVVAVRVSLREVMIINLDGLAQLSPDISMRTCVELGHALGNQHWPALVKGGVVYVPLTVDKNVMASVMRTHRFEAIRYEFVPGSEILPYLAPHESRRLFGGAEGPVHSHTHESFVGVDEETGGVYGRPPARAHTHHHDDRHGHSHAAPAGPSVDVPRK
jgi:urease accessory protein